MSTEWPEGVGRRIYDSIDSTNAEAVRIAADLREPTWIMAAEQTAARGRRGRAWVAPRGNFMATLVMRPTERADQVALRSFVAAVALGDAVADVTGTAAGITLKWPNDVLLNGGKLAGILLESVGQNQGQGVQHLSIGIGVNLIAAPGSACVEPGALPPVSLMGETGVRVAPEDLLSVLAARYAARDAQFVTYGFEPIRTAWLQRAARLGQVITARTSRDTHEGTFEEVDETGALVLKTAIGRVAIAAADVFF